MFGILNIYKPSGISSHDVVYKVRRAMGTKRVGHAGTLDPMATGVLVVGVGSATKFLQYLPLEPKIYEFEAKFGQSTNTQDSEGEVLNTRPVPANLEELISASLGQLVGNLDQLPPMFSALKKDGVPLYEYARKGEEVERKTRPIVVHSFEMLSIEGDVAKFKCVCGGGTYVRTLCHDLGELVGCGAHMISLVRTAVGGYKLENAVELEELTTDNLVPLIDALMPIETVTLPKDIEIRIRQGQKVPILPLPSRELVCMLDSHGEMIGLAKIENGSLVTECNLPTEYVSKN